MPPTCTFPSYGLEAANFLIRERRVSMIGVDTASIDPGTSQDFPVHRLAAANNVAGIENLANLDALPATGATVIALPMKIAGGSAVPRARRAGAQVTRRRKVPQPKTEGGVR